MPASPAAPAPPSPAAPPQAPRPPQGRRDPATRPVDASMDLLLQIIRQPVDPDYAASAARGATSSRRHWLLGVVAVLIGVMFAVAAVQNTRAAPALQSERTGLIDRVQAAEAQQDALRDRATALSGEIATLRAAALGSDGTAQQLEGQIATLGPVAGTVAVTGPGVVVVVDDAPEAADAAEPGDRVLDLDLQILANGLWQAGAEAVAVNGHRLSALTAIRSAGDAITVDYRSLNRPYRVEAIGDPRTLPAGFAESPAGAWWHDLEQNRGMRYEVGESRSLELAADPGLTLRWARVRR
ncbi:DUF881 domain-containing protein [Microlunatus capsulatus]|uniref:Uncharacterized protein YlxW (UPF0749 family) n=1 Tax=Microlunatus capsulatus TaxID=99117 RepID=A0ABS4Z2D3_9ACTN|nr:DUF881 domain-containing protein [Microlunatus capsulatus]MBP2415209.1 uncharacterized protein YlxW (UPF0749 family) [Microlunatus capsulatus]